MIFEFVHISNTITSIQFFRFSWRLFGWSYFRIDSKLVGCIQYRGSNQQCRMDSFHGIRLGRADSVNISNESKYVKQNLN